MPDFKKMSDDELSQAADNGLRGSGAVVEMQRRLRDSNTRLTWVNLALTVAAVILAAVQVWLVFYPPHSPSATQPTAPSTSVQPSVSH